MEQTVCRHWRQGDCKFGESCRYLHSEPQKRVGIDIGGVIIKKVGRGDDTSFFGDNYLSTPISEGCFEAIKEIVDVYGVPVLFKANLRGADNVFLVSKAGKEIQRKTREWLQHHNFWEYV
jgi:hypothetical protein